MALTSKVGVDSCAQITVKASAPSELVGGGLLLCKTYADKVYLFAFL